MKVLVYLIFAILGILAGCAIYVNYDKYSSNDTVDSIPVVDSLVIDSLIQDTIEVC